MNEEKKSRPWEWAVLGALIFLPILYFLSYGPMTKIYYDSSDAVFDTVYEILYWPIEWLWINTPLDGPIDWYEELWE